MKKVSLTLIFALLLLACQKDSLSEVELQTTISISNIQITTADVNLTGQVLNSDESFNWGVAYSVNPDPRMDNNRGNATTAETQFQIILQLLIYCPIQCIMFNLL